MKTNTTTTGSTLQREYSLGSSRRQNPKQLSRRRQYLYELEELLEIELDALSDSRPRLTNNDLKEIFKALLDEFNAKPAVVVFHSEENTYYNPEKVEATD